MIEKYHLANYDDVRIGFGSVKWVEEFRNKKLEECYSIFGKIYEKVEKDFIPVVKKTAEQMNSVPADKETRKLIKEKTRLS